MRSLFVEKMLLSLLDFSMVVLAITALSVGHVRIGLN